MQWDLNEISLACSGHTFGDEQTVVGISTDSRSIASGDLFIALKGPNFDGHDYIELAKSAGAVAVLVEHKMDTTLPQIVVDNSLLALGKIAQAWKRKHAIKLVAITGSNGKTTVKEMTAAILNVSNMVLSTKGNLNNDIGVPLTLLRIRDEHQYAVIEMGANHPKEIEYLTQLAEPDVAIVTNAGNAHLEGFGGLDGVASAKAEIYSGLDKNGIAIINHDDNYFNYWKDLNEKRTVLSFGLKTGADVTCDYSVTDKASKFVLNKGKQSIDVELALLGAHNILNALAASSVAFALNVKIKDIKIGLESLQPVAGRLQLNKGRNGSRIIDDTYNANPSSLSVALTALTKFSGRHYLALGDMGELGDGAEKIHTEIGQQAKQYGVNKLFTLGPLAKFSASGFGQDAACFTDQKDMIAAIDDELMPDVTLLVKGSRLMKMENIVHGLVQRSAEEL